MIIRPEFAFAFVGAKPCFRPHRGIEFKLGRLHGIAPTGKYKTQDSSSQIPKFPCLFSPFALIYYQHISELEAV